MSRTLRNLLAGAGRIFDFSGSYSTEAVRRVQARRILVSRRSTRDALGGDWVKIGKDIAKALDKAEEHVQR